MAPTSRHVPGIDAWRGLSVLLVMAHHVAIRLPLAASDLGAWLPQRLMRALCWNGYDAVMIFFVVSGFLITTHTLRRHGSPDKVSLRDFWSRRVARIAPPLLLLVAVLAGLHLAGIEHFTIDTDRQSLGLAVLSALTFWLNAYEAKTGYLPGNWDVLWSLSVEEVFYLAFPLLLWLARTERRVVAVLVPLVVLMPVFHALPEQGIASDKAYLPCMGAIAAGVLTALLARRLRDDRAMGWALSLGGGALLLSVLGWGDLWWSTVQHATLTMHVLGTSAALLGAWMLRGEYPLAVLAPLRGLGRLSYEVYLTHMFVVFAVVELWEAMGWGKAEGAWAYPLVFAGSTALGWAFARGWSEPCNRAIRHRLLPSAE